MWTCVDGICTWCKSDCPASQHLLQCLSWSSWTPCTMYISSGLGLAVLAAVCNGSFSALAKCQRVKKAKVPAYIFNFWLCTGVCLASVPIAYGTKMRCAGWQGLLSGTLFVTSTAASMQAIQYIGLSQAIGIGCGTAALVSFIFGAVVENGSITHLPRALGGIACLLTGVALVAWAGTLQQTIADKQQQQQDTRSSTVSQHPASAAVPQARDGNDSLSQLQHPLLSDSTDLEGAAVADQQQQQQQQVCEQQQRRQRRCRHITLGLLLAVVTGILGGLILAPMDYIGRECRGLPYQAALAAGVLLAAPVVTYCVHWCTTGKMSVSLPTYAVAAAGPGVLAGIIWAGASVSSMLATTTIGLAISYPIMQSGMFVAGLWGILLYGELYSLQPHLAYWSGGALLAAGVVLVSGAGQPQ